MKLDRTGKFFQPENYILERFDICDFIERRGLELRQEGLYSLWFKPFCDRFQAPKSACR